MNVKHWNILSWNIRGINSDTKWNAIRDHLSDHLSDNNCDVLCLQETKHESFDLSYLRNFCPASFDSYVYLPSVGASGGSIVIWRSAILSSTMVFHNSYATSIEFTSLHNNVVWVLTNIYAPCTPQGKREFINWFKNIQIPDHIDWLVLGDFNLYRSPDDRNRDGADYAEMFLFNEAISALGLVEFPSKEECSPGLISSHLHF